MGGDRLDIRQLRLKPAGPLDRLPRQLESTPIIATGRSSRVEVAENLAVVLDQPLGDLLPLGADLVKLCLRPLDDRRGPFAEHFRQLVACPRLRDWTRDANSAVRFGWATSRITAASAAWASPAKSATERRPRSRWHLPEYAVSL